MHLLHLALAASAPQGGPLVTPVKPREFGDWVVGCDNALACKATALGPEADPFDKALASIERDPGPGGAVRVTIGGQAEVKAPIAISVDGTVVARGGTVDGRFAGTEAFGIARAFAKGRGATIAMGGSRSALSLTGAAAALRYMDDRQGRAGTRGALVATGPAADTRAPRPALPVIRVPRTTGKPAALSPALIATMRKTADCQEIAVPEMNRVEAHALGGGRTLAIVPCGLGAYQGWSAIYVVAAGGVVPAPFDVKMNDGGDEPVPLLTTAAFERGILSSYAKGRGLGDCGFGQTFAWDGTRFRLTEQAEMPACRGSLDLITTWRATVVR